MLIWLNVCALDMPTVNVCAVALDCGTPLGKRVPVLPSSARAGMSVGILGGRVLGAIEIAPRYR